MFEGTDAPIFRGNSSSDPAVVENVCFYLFKILPELAFKYLSFNLQMAESLLRNFEVMQF